MKNQQQIAICMGLGALITVILLLVMGRLRTERYEEASEEELMQFLDEVEQEKTPAQAEPSPMGDDSDDED
jgi:hypothetical protein